MSRCASVWDTEPFVLGPAWLQPGLFIIFCLRDRWKLIVCLVPVLICQMLIMSPR